MRKTLRLIKKKQVVMMGGGLNWPNATTALIIIVGCKR
jgi:uridylate kinase